MENKLKRPSKMGIYGPTRVWRLTRQGAVRCTFRVTWEGVRVCMITNKGKCDSYIFIC